MEKNKIILHLKRAMKIQLTIQQPMPSLKTEVTLITRVLFILGGRTQLLAM